MARFSNPFYQDASTSSPDPVMPVVDLGGAPARQVRYQNPTAEIGSNLVNALFGNPAAAAKQREMQAQADARDAAAEEARAHAQVYRGQSTGLDTTNAANTGLPELFANLYKTTAPIAARAPVGLESDDAGEIPAVAGVNADQAMKAGMPALLAAMVQGGHAANVGGVTQALAAFGGGDEMARRGLVSAGHSPTKDFALTPERADQIAGAEQASKLAQALGVANINHATDIPVANIRAGALRDVATINNRDGIAKANIAANSRVDAAGARGGANSLGTMIGSLYPEARVTSGDRSQAAQDGLIARGATGAVHSYHVPGNGGSAIDMAPIPGKTLSQVVGDLRASGADVIEAKDETSPGQGTGPHWHIAVRDTGKPSAWAKAPPRLSSADDKSVEHALAVLWNATTTDGGGSTPQPSFSAIDLNGPSKTLLKARTADLLQSGGNLASAAQQATREYWAAVRANGGKVAAWKPGLPITAARAARPTTGLAAKSARTPVPADRGNPSYPDAKRAPDGNLYVIISPKGAPVKYGMVPG